MRLTKVQAALGLGTAVLAFAGAVASATAWFAKRLSDVDARIEKLDRAIKALNVNTTDEKYKELIKELLAEQEVKTRAMPSKLRPQAPHAYAADSGVSASAPATVKPPE